MRITLSGNRTFGLLSWFLFFDLDTGKIGTHRYKPLLSVLLYRSSRVVFFFGQVFRQEHETNSLRLIPINFTYLQGKPLIYICLWANNHFHEKETRILQTDNIQIGSVMIWWWWWRSRCNSISQSKFQKWSHDDAEKLSPAHPLKVDWWKVERAHIGRTQSQDDSCEQRKINRKQRKQFKSV